MKRCDIMHHSKAAQLILGSISDVRLPVLPRQSNVTCRLLSNEVIASGHMSIASKEKCIGAPKCG